MENFIISLNVISPLFFLLAIGYTLTRLKMFNESVLNTMNDVCFKAFFPLLLFNSIYKTDFKQSFNPKLLGFAVLVVVTIFILLCIVIPLIEKDNKKRGVLIQGIFRSNFVIFGLPISIALCGEENVGPTSILIAVIVPLYNALSVIALEVCRGEKIRPLKVVKGILTNPLVIGGIFGMTFLLLNIKLPQPITKTVSDIANLTTPLALILLGGSFKFDEVKTHLKQLIIGVTGKLIVIPLIFIPIAILVGYRSVELVALVVMIAAPTAVSTYTMASQMDADSSLAGQIVVFDSIGSIVTMFLWIFTLKQIGLF